MQSFDGLLGVLNPSNVVRDELVGFELTRHVALRHVAQLHGQRVIRARTQRVHHPQAMSRPTAEAYLKDWQLTSTRIGISFRVFQPPNAVPIQRRPVTSWKGRVEISLPEAATPITHETPQPRWAHSRAARMTSVLPAHHKARAP